MVEIVFREAVRADLPAIVDLLREDAIPAATESGSGPVYDAAFDAMQRDGGTVLVVGEVSGRIVATYQLTLITGLSLSAARRAQIEGVRVLRERRGQGLGAMLMLDAEARARAGGATMMQMTSNANRIGAHRFYQRLGYTKSHAGFRKPV